MGLRGFILGVGFWGTVIVVCSEVRNPRCAIAPAVYL